MNYRTIYCWLLLFFCFVSSALAQGPNLANITPPSPDSKAFQKYGDIPVSAYTGVPNISIPLYTIKSRDITVPITLSYHSAGIKVSEDATDVGLGWVLNAGGNLSRNIVGYDDWDGNTYFNGSGGNNITDFAGYVGPTTQMTTGCSVPMFNKAPNASQTLWNYDITSYVNAVPAFDFQPDQYYYNFQGHSGKFEVLRSKQTVIQNLEKVQIYPTASDGSTWESKTADGFTYDFTAYEYYHDNEYTTGGTASNHITTWYLTKITSPLGNTVTFTYTPTSNFVQTVGGYSETRDDWDNANNDPTLPVASFGWQKGYNPGQQYYGQLLSEIDFTNGKLVFNYSYSRQDLSGAAELDSIGIFRTGQTTPDKTIAMTYGYFTGTVDPSFNNTGTITTQQSLRLKLEQVTEKGYYGGQFIQNPPYTFTYNESALPAKTSFARDHWGYYNGVTGRTTLIPDPIPISNSTNPVINALGIPGTQRDANPLYTSAFILTQINYPTGGYTTFDFESNDFDQVKSEINDFSWFATQQVILSQETQTGYDIQEGDYLGVGQTIDLTQEYLNPDGSYPQVSLSAAFRLTGGTGTPPTSGTCNTIQLPANVVYFELIGPNGNVIDKVDPGALPTCGSGVTGACAGCQSGSPVFSYYQTYSLAPAVYTWLAYVQPNNSYMSQLQDIHATYTWYSTPAAATDNLVHGGGLRILQITDHDGINESNDKIRHYVYDTYNSNNQEHSYGRRMSNPEYNYFKLSDDINSQDNGDGCVSQNYFGVHLMRSSDSDVPLNGSAAGVVVGYDTVTELEGENGEYGQKVYTYINNPDVVSSWLDQYSGNSLPEQPPYGSNVPTMTNGSLLSETDYVNNSGNMVMVKQVNNQYSTLSTLSTNENTIYGLTDRALPVVPHGGNCISLLNSLCTGNEVMTYQSMQSAWNVLSQKQELTYDQLNPALNSNINTQYFYDNYNHLQLTRTVTNSSNGQIMTKYMQYPLDFANVTATDPFTLGVANLQNSFMVNVPVETYIQRSNTDGTNSRVTNAVLTYFNASTPTPSLVDQTEVTSPITNFVAATTGGSGLVANATYQPQVSFDSYDSYGNILQQHKVNGMNQAYCWDYLSTLPICVVKNAAQSDIAYTSFEADGSGNWVITGGSVVAGGITGNSSFQLGSGASITKPTLTAGNSYTVSYWTTNSAAYSIAGTQSGYPVKGKTITINGNTWTYYEHLITGVSNLSITGTGNIDELRLYPSTAQMMTYTYTPLIGMTSSCDVDNRVTYYFYDGLERLSYIRDQDGNILKTFQYHYMNQ